MLAEFLLGIGNKSLARICYIYGIFSFIVLFYLIDNDKMVLIPVYNTRHRILLV